MPVDPTFRDLFGGDESQVSGQLDARTIIRKARRRRLPRQIGVGSVATIAAVGVFTGAGFGLRSLTPSGASGGAVSLGSQTDSPPASANDGSTPGGPTPAPIKRASGDRLNLCGATLVHPLPSATGLTLTVDFADAAAGAPSVDGTVTLTNTGDAAVDGDAYALPTIVLSQNDTVLWHSHDLVIRDPMPIQLTPGRSVVFDASFEPVRCELGDDRLQTFPTDLPRVAAGEYQVSAVMDVTVNSNAELVTGPAANIRVR